MTAWRNRNPQAMSALLTTPDPAILTQIGSVTAGLHAVSIERTAGAPVRKGDTATATITSTYKLAAAKAWQTTTSITLQQQSGAWRVAWMPSALYPSLPAGGTLTATYEWGSRANILGAGNTPLTSNAPRVVVGIEGSRIKNTTQLSTVLEQAGATSQQVSSALAQAAAHPDFFTTVFSMSQSTFKAQGGRSSQLYQIPGTVFEHVTGRSTASPGLAQHLVGTVGTPTAEQLSKLGAAYSTSTPVGQTGLEEYYQTQLAGTPGVSVEVKNSAGKLLSTKVVLQPVPGTPVKTSVNLTVQKAAEAALSWAASNNKLSTQDGIAAIVAVNTSTGQLLATANLTTGSGYDYALQGNFPPGSTFKILTSTALIDAGLSPSSAASCPPTTTVDGEVFHNAEGDSQVTNLLAAFTESCNTAFIQLATSHLKPSSFSSVATLYGLGRAVQMGYPAFAGSVPEPASEADLAATSIGQGRVVVSPLDMAEVAAAVGSGTVHPARLVQGAPADSATGTALPATTVSDLRQMMASVVASGTASGTGLPSGTHAKTGTAEYGTGKTLPIDAWLVGYDGNIAFAIVQHDSRLDGGPANGPIMAKFLNSLPASLISRAGERAAGQPVRQQQVTGRRAA